MNVSRSQLAKFLPDNEAIRVFEEVIRVASGAEKSAGTVGSPSTSAGITPGAASFSGLGLNVSKGQAYRFEFNVVYDVDGAAGTLWTIQGPNFDVLAYESEYSLTASSKTVVNANSYGLPASANASSAYSTGNIARISGMITPNESGTIRLMCAPASGELRIRQGSHSRLIRLT